jgi:hypothetical protein
MYKNFTLFPIASYLSHDKKDLKENVSDEIPGDAVIQNILNFSKALKVEKSTSAGSIEIILN